MASAETFMAEMVFKYNVYSMSIYFYLISTSSTRTFFITDALPLLLANKKIPFFLISIFRYFLAVLEKKIMFFRIYNWRHELTKRFLYVIHFNAVSYFDHSIFILCISSWTPRIHWKKKLFYEKIEFRCWFYSFLMILFPWLFKPFAYYLNLKYIFRS